jgi:hypothetical protein
VWIAIVLLALGVCGIFDAAGLEIPRRLQPNGSGI